MPAADLLLAGGSVLASHPGVGAEPVTHLAVSAGRIVGLGGAEVRDLAGRGTREVDLAGGLLVPGFQDAHIHPVQGGLERLGCDLSGLRTEADYVTALAAFAGRRTGLDWISGAGWRLAAFPGGLPRREALDSVVPDRPVMLINCDHHGAWVNSAALRRAGVGATTPDPPDGRIERDPDGTPTGMLHEGAMNLVETLIPEPTLAEQVAGLLEAQRYLHSLGITAWQDAILGRYANIVDASAAYAACADDRTLTARVVGALWWDRNRGAEQIDELVERRSTWTRDRFRPTSVKVMQDGIVENFTAGLLAPYLDRFGVRTDNTGQSLVDPASMGAYVAALDAVGFQVHFHAIGDRAVREALDACETALRANGVGDGRHHVAHIQVVDPADVGRFAKLGVAGNMQAFWACHEDQMDDLTLPFLPAERAGHQYPFGSLHRGGARLVAGSDWPVSSPNPLWGIHVAVNRQLPPAAGEVRPPFLVEQSLDVVTALDAYTAGSAYVNHHDDTGEIRVGARADFAVLDRDIRVCQPDAIGETRVLATYVDGVEVFAI